MKKNAAKGNEKTKPISEKPKMNANVFITKDYENETTLRPQKNKPNQTQFPSRNAKINFCCGLA